MTQKVPLDLGVIVVTIIVWVAAWQLFKIMADKLNKNTKIIVYIVIIIVSLFLLYWLFQQQEEINEE